jgi:CheY-like chemotaxis protein
MQLQQDWQNCPYCRTPVHRAPPVVASVTPAPAPKVPLPAGPISADRAPQRQYRVLVVDDEPDFRRLITLFLEQSDLPIAVTVAANGSEALEFAQMNPPDLILLDIMMPEMDGFDVCARLRANVRTTFIPILMLTALNDPNSRTRAFLVGTDDYVSKPFDRTELLARVRRVLQRTYGLMPARDGLTQASEPAARAGLDSLGPPANPAVTH